MKNLLKKNSFKKTIISSKIFIDNYRDKIDLFFGNGDLYPSPVQRQFLEKIEAHRTHHLKGRSLYRHLLGTYRILKKWQGTEEVCLAGLYHSIYGTYNYRVEVLSLESREILQRTIGMNAEKMVYYFCCEDRKHFSSNLDRTENFILKNWRQPEDIPLSEDEFKALLALRLADHLEQLPYTGDYRYGEFYRKARPFLSPIAFQDFSDAYNGRIPDR